MRLYKANPPLTLDGAAAVSVRFESPFRAEQRRAHSMAGRYCAGRALEALTGVYHQVERSKGGAPLWPEGFVGSITHTDCYASSVVGPRALYRGIGIDSEVIKGHRKVGALGRRILAGQERSLLEGLGEAQGLHLIFSAKESLYKCIYPLVETYFGFQDAELTQISADDQSFRVALLRPLGDFPQGSVFTGWFKLESSYIHTCVVVYRVHSGSCTVLGLLPKIVQDGALRLNGDTHDHVVMGLPDFGLLGV